MAYTPNKEDMAPLGFLSVEKDTSHFKIWTNQTNTRQIRAHRNPGNTWLDFYERDSAALPWRKRTSGPSLPTKTEFLTQLLDLQGLQGLPATP
ncbi:MAG: hypothetical protein ACRYFX_09550 [Janthinobacterium lividum]